MKRIAERGFTLVEIMIVVAIIALLAAIAIPNVLRGRTTANETSSIGNLRALVSSLEMYRSVNNVYPQTANWGADMYPGAGVPAFGPPSFNLATLAASQIQGYAYTFTAGPGGCTDLLLNCVTYVVSSVPVIVNQTGTRAFFVSEAGTIRHVTGAGPASVTCNTIDQGPSVAGSC